jgi:cell division protein FtsW (lipid II flippase)
LQLKEILVGVLILAAPVGLIMLEPDAGQAMTYFPISPRFFFSRRLKFATSF